MSALRTRLRALVLLGLLAASCAAPEVATRSPTSTVATSTPSAATTSSRTPGKESTGPTASGRPGLITRIDGPIVVRTESDSTPIRTVPSFQLSADGSRVTYWTESAGAAELHVLELGGGDRIVTKFPDRRPGGIAWSTDATGLLVSVAEPGDARYLIPRIVIAVDIGSGTTREIYRGTGPSGASVIPLVWRRSPEIFAAYETGPGGYSFGYTVIRPGQPSVRTDPDDPVVGMAASSDGAVVSGLWMREGGGVLKVWPVDDFAKKTELRVVAGEQLAQPRWWPGRSEIAFAAGRLADGAYRDARIERWDPAGGARTVLKRLPDMGNLGAYLIRADGSGLLTQGAYPPGAWEVTDLRTGATAPIPQRPGESILGTVLLR
jgi:hypothetical protein